MSQVLTLCHLRFKGLFSGGFLYLMIIGSLVIFLTSLLGGVVIGELTKVVEDLGLRIISLVGVALCIAAGAGELRRDAQDGGLSFLLSKPIARSEVVAGKAVGLFLVVSMLVLVLGLFLWLLLLFLGQNVALSFLKPLILIVGEVLIVSAMITFFSSFTTPYLSGLFTLSLYVTGLVLGDLYVFGKKFGGPAVEKLTLVLYYVLPNLRDFHVSGRAIHGIGIGWGDVFFALLYSLSYSMFLLMLAVWLFQKKDL